MDAETVRRASRARWGDLLAAGAEIVRIPADHVSLQSDDRRRPLVSVGSTNFDNRSFRLNDEANLNIYDEGFARQQIEIFQQDLAQSRRYTLQEWKQRPLREKLLEHAASLFGAQL